MHLLLGSERTLEFSGFCLSSFSESNLYPSASSTWGWPRWWVAVFSIAKQQFENRSNVTGETQGHGSEGLATILSPQGAGGSEPWCL